ncbi:hypothetical protein [Acidovorax sp.]|uniref:hypothetical protein n=1 Tax=Acidovorax sp. TaxID=1872122 RepID=UPI002604B723|nr:hypothetical protein [Acidovorax sp.]
MKLRTPESIYANPCDDDYEGMAHICCTGENGYWFSLSRHIGDNSVEVMVLDQINHKMSDIQVTLSETCLIVDVGNDGARHLDGNSNYQIAFTASPEELNLIDQTLKVLLNGTGTYSKL